MSDLFTTEAMVSGNGWLMNVYPSDLRKGDTHFGCPFVFAIEQPNGRWMVRFGNEHFDMTSTVDPDRLLAIVRSLPSAPTPG